MNKALLHNRLIEWYEQNHRILPWRETDDPYKIWISEIILQQTRVAQGMEYYHRLVTRFPDIQSLADAEEDEVLLYWQGLGYYSRARNLHKAAQLMKNHAIFHQAMRRKARRYSLRSRVCLVLAIIRRERLHPLLLICPTLRWMAMCIAYCRDYMTARLPLTPRKAKSISVSWQRIYLIESAHDCLTQRLWSWAPCIAYLLPLIAIPVRSTHGVKHWLTKR